MENNEEKVVPETITESEAKELEENAITREEAIEQGIDVEKAESEAIPVEVVPDQPDTLKVEVSEEVKTEDKFGQ